MHVPRHDPGDRHEFVRQTKNGLFGILLALKFHDEDGGGIYWVAGIVVLKMGIETEDRGDDLSRDCLSYYSSKKILRFLIGQVNFQLAKADLRFSILNSQLIREG